MVDKSGGKLRTHGNSVSRWEIGSHTPSLQDMEILAKVLKVRKEWLMTGKGEMHSRIDIDDFKL